MFSYIIIAFAVFFAIVIIGRVAFSILIIRGRKREKSQKKSQKLPFTKNILPMAILLLMLAVIVSVALFFMLAIKFGNQKTAPKDILDLDSIPRPIKEKEKVYVKNEDDLIV